MINKIKEFIKKNKKLILFFIGILVILLLEVQTLNVSAEEIDTSMGISHWCEDYKDYQNIDCYYNEQISKETKIFTSKNKVQTILEENNLKGLEEFNFMLYDKNNMYAKLYIDLSENDISYTDDYYIKFDIGTGIEYNYNGENNDYTLGAGLLPFTSNSFVTIEGNFNYYLKSKIEKCGEANILGYKRCVLENEIPLIPNTSWEDLTRSTLDYNNKNNNNFENLTKIYIGEVTLNYNGSDGGIFINNETIINEYNNAYEYSLTLESNQAYKDVLENNKNWELESLNSNNSFFNNVMENIQENFKFYENGLEDILLRPLETINELIVNDSNPDLKLNLYGSEIILPNMNNVYNDVFGDVFFTLIKTIIDSVIIYKIAISTFAIIKQSVENSRSDRIGVLEI